MRSGRHFQIQESAIKTRRRKGGRTVCGNPPLDPNLRRNRLWIKKGLKRRRVNQRRDPIRLPEVSKWEKNTDERLNFIP